MKESRYSERVGGITDGRFRRDQYSGAGSRKFEFGRESSRSLSSLADSGFEFDEDVEFDDRIEFERGHRPSERQYDGRLGLSGVGDAGRSVGQGGGDPFTDLAGDLSGAGQCSGGQDSGQPAEVAEVHRAVAGPDAGSEQAGELAALIAEASSALAHLDAPALEELSRKAEALATLNLGSSGVKDRAMAPVLEARFRVFAALLKATGENVATLRRTDARDPLNTETYVAQGSEPRGLFESFGMYDDSDLNDSIWPVNAISPTVTALPDTNPKKNGSGQA